MRSLATDLLATRTATTPSGDRLTLRVATTARARTVGLLGQRSSPDSGLGLLIERCDSVHMFGMRWPIDVVFVRWPPPDRRVEVLAARPELRPWRLARVRRRTLGLRRREVAALELAAGSARRMGLHAGAALELDDAAWTDRPFVR